MGLGVLWESAGEHLLVLCIVPCVLVHREALLMTVLTLDTPIVLEYTAKQSAKLNKEGA